MASANFAADVSRLLRDILTGSIGIPPWTMDSNPNVMKTRQTRQTVPVTISGCSALSSQAQLPPLQTNPCQPPAAISCGFFAALRPQRQKGLRGGAGRAAALASESQEKRPQPLSKTLGSAGLGGIAQSRLRLLLVEVPSQQTFGGKRRQYCKLPVPSPADSGQQRLCRAPASAVVGCGTSWRHRQRQKHPSPLPSLPRFH